MAVAWYLCHCNMSDRVVIIKSAWCSPMVWCLFYYHCLKPRQCIYQWWQIISQTNAEENSIDIEVFPFWKLHLKTSFPNALPCYFSGRGELIYNVISFILPVVPMHLQSSEMSIWLGNSIDIPTHVTVHRNQECDRVWLNTEIISMINRRLGLFVVQEKCFVSATPRNINRICWLFLF